ncbi:tail fiber assembly protein [Paraburkholderia sp. J10-1]|uniref:tail fiber assembly protein n=1 Tax=Paraburkholderia sp. J10-1 TaxID=2805430 RepID=UPI002AB60033|nr:tail fiber assembly protein [Paraburkholderia sp. J10-1]
MFVHQYDSLTGQYTGSRLADPDPQNADRWLIPAFATDVPMPEVPRNAYPFFIDGAWLLLPDYRGQRLYRISDGSPAEIGIAGIGPEQVDLTEHARPSADHTWNGNEWALDPELAKARERAEALAEFEKHMDAARVHTIGMADAQATGLLSVGEAAVFKAWSAYQLALVRVVNGQNFPGEREWPAEPDESAVIAEAEAAEARRLEEEAQRAAEEESRFAPVEVEEVPADASETSSETDAGGRPDDEPPESEPAADEPAV